MKALTIGTAALVAALSALPIAATAQAPATAPPEAGAAAQEPIFGSQMMTVQERNEYRARMQAAKSIEERNRIRDEHHTQMVARAKERGVTLPDEPPMRGRGGGMGPGSGMGAGGMGPGGGIGPGGMGSGGMGSGGMGPGGMGGGRR